jgi:Tfp pilus assembly protein PilE
MVVTQNISLVGVKNDLVAIAQAERMYYTQNGSYADLPTLTSTGTMNIARTSRDGYTYSVEPSGNSFTATATYTAPPVANPAGVTPPHFPTFTIDQTMEVHQGD